MFKKFHWESRKLSWYGLRGASRNYDSKLWGRLDLTAMLRCATNICHKQCSWFLSSDKTIIRLFRWNSKVNKQISGLSCNSSFTSSRRWWIGKIYFGNHCYLKYISVVIICAKITNKCWQLTIPRWSRCEFYTLRTHSQWRKEQKRKQTSGNISYHFGVWLYVKQ